MALALAPIAASLAGVAEPAVASLLGPAIAKNLTPMAKAGLEKIVKSKVAGKAVHKIGNALFGKKHKTARKLMKKGRSIAGVPGGGKILGKGLDLAGDLGMLDKHQREAIKTGHEKAMSLHDQLSEMNKPDKSGKMDYSEKDDERDNDERDNDEEDKQKSLRIYQKQLDKEEEKLRKLEEDGVMAGRGGIQQKINTIKQYMAMV